MDYAKIVRGLLEKAERTENPAEAIALNEKAMYIMAKWGIDDAWADSRTEEDTIINVKIRFVGTYAKNKSVLYGALARAFRCHRVVLERRTNLFHLFGYKSDIEKVDFLYNSLLVQALRFLAEEMMHVETLHGENKKSFSTQWWGGYVIAISKRLDDANKNAVDDSKPGTGIVLYDRSQLVDSAMHSAYENIAKGGKRYVTMGAGYHAGTRDGNRADLGTGRIGGGKKALA